MHLGTCQSCLISACRYFSTRLATHMYSITNANYERNELAYCVKCNAVVCVASSLHCQMQVQCLGLKFLIIL